MAEPEFLERQLSQEELNQLFETPLPAGGPVVPSGHTLGTQMTITDKVITATKCDVVRDDALILRKLNNLAAYAGEALYYTWPVKDRRTGKVKTVEGLTIKAANVLVREYRNAKIDLDVADRGAFWIFKALLIDYENGVSYSHLYQQHKGAAKIGGDDDQRRLDMAFGIGQSKCKRGAVVNYLEMPFGDYLLEQAKQNLIGRVSGKIEQYKQRIIDRLAELDVELVRVERIRGKPLAEWLARDVARTISEIQAVADEMSSPNALWPREAPPEPRRGDAVTDLDEQGEPAAASPTPRSHGEAAAGPAAISTPPENTAGSEPPVPPSSEVQTPAAAADIAGERTEGSATGGSAPIPRLRNWTIPPSVLGQDAILRALGELLDMTETDADQDDFERQNAERIAKITGVKGQQLKTLLRERRRARGAANAND